jgi:hypothetical protein
MPGFFARIAARARFFIAGSAADSDPATADPVAAATLSVASDV